MAGKWLRAAPISSFRSGNRQVFTYYDSKQFVEVVAWSPDGKHIAIGEATPGPSPGVDNTAPPGPLQIIDAQAGSKLQSFQAHVVVSVSWSPESVRLATGSGDELVRIWDLDTGRAILVYQGHREIALSNGHYASDFIKAVGWSPDGARIASAGEDATAQVWNAATGALISMYRGHKLTVNTLAWSPDGKHIASGGDGLGVHVWDVASGHLIYTYTGQTDVISQVAWSLDGRYVASGGEDTTIQVWKPLIGSGMFPQESGTVLFFMSFGTELIVV